MATVFSNPPLDSMKTDIQTLYCFYGSWEFKSYRGVLLIWKMECRACTPGSPQKSASLPSAANYISAKEASKACIESSVIC